MKQNITKNTLMKQWLASDYSDESDAIQVIDFHKIDSLARSVSEYENGLYVFLHAGFGPGKYARFSESAVYDNGSATSFRLHHFVTRVRHISPSAALFAATRLSEAVFCRLQSPGIEWDYRFFVGGGAGTVAGKSLTADQPVTVFCPEN